MACRLCLQINTRALNLCTLEDLQIENTFVEELPADPENSNVPRQVFGALHTATEPTPVSTAPTLVHFSRETCELLGLDPEEVTRPEFPLIFSGCAPLPDGKPYAQVCGSCHKPSICPTWVCMWHHMVHHMA